MAKSMIVVSKKYIGIIIWQTHFAAMNSCHSSLEKHIYKTLGIMQPIPYTVHMLTRMPHTIRNSSRSFKCKPNGKNGIYHELETQ